MGHISGMFDKCRYSRSASSHSRNFTAKRPLKSSFDFYRNLAKVLGISRKAPGIESQLLDS